MKLACTSKGKRKQNSNGYLMTQFSSFTSQFCLNLGDGNLTQWNTMNLHILCCFIQGDLSSYLPGHFSMINVLIASFCSTFVLVWMGFPVLNAFLIWNGHEIAHKCGYIYIYIFKYPSNYKWCCCSVSRCHKQGRFYNREYGEGSRRRKRTIQKSEGWWSTLTCNPVPASGDNVSSSVCCLTFLL